MAGNGAAVGRCCRVPQRIQTGADAFTSWGTRRAPIFRFTYSVVREACIPGAESRQPGPIGGLALGNASEEVMCTRLAARIGARPLELAPGIIGHYNGS